MKQMTLRAAAKINLSLDVTGRREDGYHTLASIFQGITVYDTIELAVQDGAGITLTCDAPGVPCDEHNLAWKAAAAMLDAAGMQRQITIALHKEIPSGAGMGGGSADAAGVLWGLNELLGCGFTNARLREIGVTLGADVPFLLLGGTALAEGVGEILTPLKPLPASQRMILVKGTQSISTPAAYKAIDALTEPAHPDTEAMLRAVETQDMALLRRSCGNLFEEAIDCADVTRAKQRLTELGAECAVMTGSGAAVFGLYPENASDQQIADAAAVLRQEFPFVQIAAPAEQPFIVL